MTNFLAQMIAEKEREVASLQHFLSRNKSHLMNHYLYGKKIRQSYKDFIYTLKIPTLTVIAEIKRRSPSRGILAEIENPRILANRYEIGSADIISVLTDQRFFDGTLYDLIEVAKYVRAPVLRKDFILHESQIAESIVFDADAILVIAAVLGKNTKRIVEAAKAMNIDAVVEVHTQAELDIALESGADIIGVNNRDLHTFEVDTECAFKLIEHIPADKVKIAESGILTPEMAQQYRRVGYDAVLIGEALVKIDNYGPFIRACRE